MNKQRLGELIANAVSHGIGVIFSITALIVLIIYAQDIASLIGILVFGICLILLYTSSTLYHSFPPSLKRVANVFQRLDHSAIYLLIAGTYTPLLIILAPSAKSYLFLGVLWTIAFIGIVLKSIWIHRYQAFHLLMYLFMGWSVILIWGDVKGLLPNDALIYLIIGGVSYTAGVIFYISRFIYAHFVWHLFVLSGSIFHFITIFVIL